MASVHVERAAIRKVSFSDDIAEEDEERGAGRMLTVE